MTTVLALTTIPFQATEIYVNNWGLTAGSGVTEDADRYVRTLVWKGTIPYTFWTEADTDQTKAIATLPAKTAVEQIYIITNTAPTGSSLSAADISVGTTGDADVDTLVLDFDTFGVAANTVAGDVIAELGADLQSGGALLGPKLYSYASTQQIDINLETTGCNVGSLTAGNWSVVIVYTVLP